MSSIENIETVAYTIAFVVPGYVWIQWEHKFVPRFSIEWSERLLGYFAHTLINYAIWLGLWLPELIDRSLKGQVGLREVAQWAAVLYFGPALGGSLTGLAKRFDWFGRLLNVFKIPSVHPIGTAWEFVFSRRRQSMARVVLKDGTEHFGWMGAKSCASTMASERDLFLQEVLVGDPLDTEPNTLGIWIPQSEIRSVRFYRHEGVCDGKQRRWWKRIW